jgi:hypothetical protein
MEVEPFPSDLDSDRYVIAIVIGLGFDGDGKSVRFEVDCCDIEGEPYPQAFAVRVPVGSLEDVARLTMHQHFRVVLDEARQQPEYIQLIDGGLVQCEVIRSFGESKKGFEFIV